MFCCARCFNDSYLIGMLPYHHSGEGKCNFCGADHAALTDASSLIEYFAPILQLYRVQSRDIGVHPDNVLPLEVIVRRDFPNIFQTQEPSVILTYLKEIIAGDPDSFLPLLSDKVCNEYLDGVESDLRDAQLQSEWEAFVREIRFINRFHLTKSINLELLGNLLKRLTKRYTAGQEFYRARISSKDSFSVTQLGKPPCDKALPGRANPEGIPYLYLSNDPKTCIYEVRPSVLDYITVGKFKLKQGIEIISLKDINEVSPFLLEDGIEDFMIHKKYLQKLEFELSKPLRRNDSHLEYLPTQYLSEYIKSLGVVGFEFRSSINKGGFNLVIFADDLFDVDEIIVYEAENIGFSRIAP
jgi:hypothetical protein